MSSEPERSPLITSRRALLAGGTLAAATGLAALLKPRKAEHRIGKAKLEDLVPATLGRWSFYTRSGVVLPELEKTVEGYDQLLSRVYEAPGLPSVMLVIAYGSTQGGSLQLHRPEICYPSQGFTLSDTRLVPLNVGGKAPLPSRTFTARRDSRIEQVLYWSRISEWFPRSSFEEYRAILAAILNGAVPDGALVRFSAIDPDPVRTRVLLQDFAKELLNAIPRQARSIVSGKLIS